MSVHLFADGLSDPQRGVFSDLDGLEWSMAVKHISKQEVEGLQFVIGVVKNIHS